MTIHEPYNTVTRRLPKWLKNLLLAMLLAWLLSPLFSSVHVEAFSARLASEAIMNGRGALGMDDQTYPVATEYLYATRPATVQALTAIDRLTGSPGMVSFRALIIVSYLVFVGSCVVFTRRWNNESTYNILLALILTPGLVEISFFFADNLPSAACACLALALISTTSSVWTYLVIGGLVGVAALFRLDGLLVLPSVLALTLLHENLNWRFLMSAGVALIAGACAVFGLSYRNAGVSIFDSMRIGSWFGRMHTESSNPYNLFLYSLILFFGLPCLVLIAAGVIENTRLHSLRWKACLLYYPLLVISVLMSRAVELRNFLLLMAPFILLYGSAGVTYLARNFRGRSGWKKTTWAAVCGVAFLVSVLPPYVRMKDGPRTLVGRLWSPIIWRQWQRSVDHDFSECDKLIGTFVSGERVLVVTSMYNADAYFHLRLLQEGFAVQPYLHLSTRAVELYTKGSISVLEIRTEDPWRIMQGVPATLPEDYVASYQAAYGLTALRPSEYDRAVLLTWGDGDQQTFIKSLPAFNRLPDAMKHLYPSRIYYPALRPAYYGSLRVIPLSTQDVSALLLLAKRNVETAEAGASSKHWRLFDNYESLHKAVDNVYWKPHDRR